jgi:hypothetical protein
MTEVWINVYEKEDGSLKGGVCDHETRAQADKEAAEGRVGCIKVSLECRFDNPPIPQEVGALIGKRVVYSWKFCDGTFELDGIVIGDYRINPEYHGPLDCIIVAECAGSIRRVTIGQIIKVLP